MEEETLICAKCGDEVVIVEIEEHVMEKHFGICAE